jgi:hypothetical protein
VGCIGPVAPPASKAVWFVQTLQTWWSEYFPRVTWTTIGASWLETDRSSPQAAARGESFAPDRFGTVLNFEALIQVEIVTATDLLDRTAFTADRRSCPQQSWLGSA